MTPEQKKAAEYAEILLAFSRGERLQMLDKEPGKWVERVWPNKAPDMSSTYRIAPKPVEVWCVIATNLVYPCISKAIAEDELASYMPPKRVALMREVTE